MTNKIYFIELLEKAGVFEKSPAFLFVEKEPF